MTATAEVLASHHAHRGTHRLTPGRWSQRLLTPLPADRVTGWVVALALGVLAGFLRFWHLGTLLWQNDPSGQKKGAGYFTGTFVEKTSHCVRYYQDIFDETYYHHDSLSLLKNGVEQNCQNTDAGFVVHPPLGKWMIGGGIHLFDDNPFGWRFSAALVGTLSVVIMVRLARRLFGSTLLGGFAGLVMAMDGLEFVQSRVALLDIFVMFFELVALACLVLDREHGRRLLARKLDAGAANRYPGPRLGFRYWRLATGAFLGAGVAVKWSGLYLIPAFAALAFAWDVGARRSANIPKPVRAAIRKDWLGWVPQFTLVPIAIYTATWTGWFLGSDKNAWMRDKVTTTVGGVTQTKTRNGFVGSIQNWFSYQCQAYNFHKNLTDNAHVGDGSTLIPFFPYCKTDTAYHDPGKLHPYLSKPFGWLVEARPVAYYYESPPNGQAGCHTSGSQGCSKEVLAIGTPMIWWFAIAALVVVAGIWAARRDWRASMILVVFAFGFFPWTADEPRQMFAFYAVPILPVVVLALTMTAGLVLGRPGSSETRRTVGAFAVGVYTVLVVVNFVYLYPILTGETLTYSAWHARIWFPGWT